MLARYRDRYTEEGTAGVVRNGCLPVPNTANREVSGDH